jgi:4-aminobutyrate aminotransferase
MPRWTVSSPTGDRVRRAGGPPVDRLAATSRPHRSIFLLNSGSEAIDGRWLARRVTGRPRSSPSRAPSTDGPTGHLITSSSPNYRHGYEPLIPSIYVAPFPGVWREFDGDEAKATEVSLARLRQMLTSVVPAASVAAIFVEPVQGEGGYLPAPIAFLQGLRSICDEHGILLVADEVQSGYGRTGRMWGFEHAGIVPDVVCIAKAIANGLPLSAIATRRELQERWGKGAHGSTYGGNPVACAAALAVLDTIEGQELVANAAARGADLRAGLSRLAAEDERIGDVRGPGLMIGVEFVADASTKAPDGALVDGSWPGRRTWDCSSVVRTAAPGGALDPPLDVSAAEVSEALEIFGEALRTV